MKRDEILKVLALIIVPGAIPIWVGYKIYESVSKSRQNEDTSGPIHNTQNDGSIPEARDE
jgi:hypothetical protein